MAMLGVLACLAGTPHVSRAIELPTGPLAAFKSEVFRTRESAQAEMLGWARQHPAEAMEALFEHARGADDPEVRERCLEVLRGLVNDEYLRDGEGFIGIQMLDDMAIIPGDPKPRKVIRVIQLVPNSAAQRAGLQVNDLIAGSGEQLWPPDLVGPVYLSFREKIRQLKPQSKIHLKVMRDGKLMDLEVTLGRRPAMADNPTLDGQSVDPDAAERSAKEAYFRRWLDRKTSGK
ncbi:MAG: hypothetical protein RLZZ282_1065 [Verrucomicrobiota bacterium]|jgi:hypothetical protein